MDAKQNTHNIIPFIQDELGVDFTDRLNQEIFFIAAGVLEAIERFGNLVIDVLIRGAN